MTNGHFFHSTDVCSALKAFWYICGPLYKFTFQLLTYLLTYLFIHLLYGV